MENTVEQLIAERSYSSLNDSEKALVSELCADEQEFNQMKQFFVSMTGISAVESYEPSAGLKSSLDSVFAGKHGGIGARLTPREIPVTQVAKVIPFYQQTWARVAAGIILFGGVFSIWQLIGNNSFESDSKSLARVEEGIPENETESLEASKEEASPKSGLYIYPQVKSEKEKSVSEDADPEVPQMYDYLLPSSPYIESNSVRNQSPTGDDNLRDDQKKSGEGYTYKTISVPQFGDATDLSFSKMKKGIDADLYPDGRKDAKVLTPESASAVASSQEDLLSYIVPAF